MPVHDWTRVEAGIFHDFHHAWIEEIKRALNGGLLPDDYYALAEQHAAGLAPDVLALQERTESAEPAPTSRNGGGTGLLLAPPKGRPIAETEMAFFRRKQNTVTVRHVSGDRIVAMVEIVSPSNKSSRNGLRAFVEKAAELLDKRVHLLILDLHPPGKRAPHGIHAAIWEEIAGEESEAPPAKPLTLVAYETNLTVRAYLETVAVADALPDMPLFLEPDACVTVPLEKTYAGAFAAVPRRWRAVLDPSASHG